MAYVSGGRVTNLRCIMNSQDRRTPALLRVRIRSARSKNVACKLITGLTVNAHPTAIWIPSAARLELVGCSTPATAPVCNIHGINQAFPLQPDTWTPGAPGWPVAGRTDGRIVRGGIFSSTIVCSIERVYRGLWVTAVGTLAARLPTAHAWTGGSMARDGGDGGWLDSRLGWRSSAEVLH